VRISYDWGIRYRTKIVPGPITLRTNYLPVADWTSGELGRRLFAQLRNDMDLRAGFKMLASLEPKPREAQEEL
jgi:hypothetical protein